MRCQHVQIRDQISFCAESQNARARTAEGAEKEKKGNRNVEEEKTVNHESLIVKIHPSPTQSLIVVHQSMCVSWLQVVATQLRPLDNFGRTFVRLLFISDIH